MFLSMKTLSVGAPERQDDCDAAVTDAAAETKDEEDEEDETGKVVLAVNAVRFASQSSESITSLLCVTRTRHTFDGTIMHMQSCRKKKSERDQCMPSEEMIMHLR
jgi:hypothetical protein